VNKKPRPILYSCGNDRVGFAIVNLFGESLPRKEQFMGNCSARPKESPFIGSVSHLLAPQ